MSINVTVIIQNEETWYVAKCIENNVASQGSTIEEALNNLTEALQLYYEDEDNIIEQHQILVTTLEVAK